MNHSTLHYISSTFNYGPGGRGGIGLQTYIDMVLMVWRLTMKHMEIIML